MHREPKQKINTNWLAMIRRYLIATTAVNALWETVQVPLYTIWHTGTAREVVQAIMHCTLGDISIATVALMVGLIVVGSAAWPTQRFGPVLIATVAVAAGYTVYSEYVNTVVRQNWSYTPMMPTLPWLGTGLTPFVQWLAVPALSLVWSYRAVSDQGGGARLCSE